MKKEPQLLDNSPDTRNELEEEASHEKTNWLSTIILLVVLLFCVVGFSFGMYHVLH